MKHPVGTTWRLVIDTNIFLSGLISESGTPARLLRAIRNKKAIHLVSDPIVEEYLRVLEYPRIRKFKKVTDAFVADIVAYLLHHTERVELMSEIKLSSDPEDDVFLETAVNGKANLLVTGDKVGLLSLRFVQGIAIVSASEAVDRLRL
jgi:putative PIN family toxin of toxin-antitoxin system